MDYITLLIGLLIGLLVGYIGNQLIQKNKKDQKEDNDQNDVFSEIKALKDEVKDYNSNAKTERGSLNQILIDMRAAEQQVGHAALEIKRTLVTGGGQKQGAWGQLILEHILENKLQFTKGEEFEVQKSFNTNDGRLIPDVIVHFPDGRDVIIDSKVSLTAWDRYVNATEESDKTEALNDHRRSIKAHIDSLASKNYQNIILMMTPYLLGAVG